MARTGVRSLSHGIVPSLSDLAAPGKRIGTPHDMRPPALERIALPDSAIEVWLACLDADADQVARCASLLSRDEQQRARRFHFEHGRRRFIVTRGILRRLPGHHLNLAPAAIAFSYGNNGKPFAASDTTRIPDLLDTQRDGNQGNRGSAVAAAYPVRGFGRAGHCAARDRFHRGNATGIGLGFARRGSGRRLRRDGGGVSR